MNSTLRLQARGYQVVFEVKQTQPVEGFLDIRIAFTLDPRLGGITVEAVPISVMLADLSRLITYFEDHITRLEQDPDSESFTFVPLDLQFQLQAFSGEVRRYWCKAGGEGDHSGCICVSFIGSLTFFKQLPTKRNSVGILGTFYLGHDISMFRTIDLLFLDLLIFFPLDEARGGTGASDQAGAFGPLTRNSGEGTDTLPL